MELEHATSPIDDGRDVVIYPAGVGWGFRLPPQHTVTVNQALGPVYLAMPGYGSGYGLDRLEETEGEVRIHIGAATDDAHAIGVGRVPDLPAYSLPRIQDELQRLTTELVNLGGSSRSKCVGAGGELRLTHGPAACPDPRAARRLKHTTIASIAIVVPRCV